MDKAIEQKQGKTTSSLYAFILAGGRGERFWPRSRRHLPKQLLNIADSKTMIEKTVSRIKPLTTRKRIFIVAGEDTRNGLLNIKLDIPFNNYFFEPQGRNTAPAIGLGAFTLFAFDPESVMIVLPADHHIKDRNAFYRCVKKAVSIAVEGYLVTFGIVPTRSETGYGYIEPGKQIRDGVCVVKKFKEKPGQKKANEYTKKRFLWNSGIFVWKTKNIIEEFKRFQPKFAKRMEQYVALKRKCEKEKMLEQIYDKTESISIDYAIMEKAADVAVIRASFGWDDVGTWSALERVLRRDENGNILVGDVVSIDTRNSIVVSNDGVVGTIGISNLVVVHTADATLILPKARAQEVKEIVRQLSTKQRLEKYT